MKDYKKASVEDLTKLVADELCVDNPSQINPNQPLKDILDAEGGDSLEFAELLRVLECDYNLRIPDDKAIEIYQSTIAQVVEYLNNSRKKVA